MAAPAMTTSDVEDLILLKQPITPESVLSNLQQRHSRGQPFTRVGSSALVVVNPARTLEVCSDVTSKTYADWAKDTTTTKVAALPANIFDLATSVFYHMLREQQDQSVTFSGESGSGKSFTRKLFVRQLCALSKSAKKKSRVISGAKKTETVLDAFGCARTVDNPNSSRFVRYSEYQFDEAGKLIGTKLLDYLLERSRVVNTPEGERNFNIFHQLLAGATADERQNLHLADASHFTYLAHAAKSVKKGVNSVTREDAALFETLRDDLKSLGVGRRQQMGMMQTLSAILHLGNVTFHDDPNRPGDACEIRNQDALVAVAELLGVLPVNLEYALTYKTKLIKKELCTVYLAAADAAKQRDLLAKTLYALVFAWLVEHINTRLDAESPATFIGVADLSGFQDYKVNGLEQLLHNFANERLHAFVNQRLFVERFEEYTFESIPALRVDYADNSAVIELIGGDSDISLLQIIDTESLRSSNYRKADTRIAEVVVEEHAKNPSFVVGKSSKQTVFGVRHYAGMVEYEVKGFSEKNSDSLSPDFVTLILGNDADIAPTSNSFVRSIFSGKAVSTGFHPRDGGVIASAQFSQKPLRHPSMKRPSGTSPKSIDGSVTASGSVRSALIELFETLRETVPWFVFCVKPNEDLSNANFDPRTVAPQLAYMNIEKIAASRAISDYSTSYLFADFVARYRVVMDPMRLPKGQNRDLRTQCRDFANASGWSAREMAIGSTRAFLSEPAWRGLEDELRTFEETVKEEQRARKRVGSKRPGSVSGSLRSGFGGSVADELESVYSSEAGGNRGANANGGDYYDDDGSYAGDGDESHYGSEFRMLPSGKPGVGAANGVSQRGEDVELGELKGRNGVVKVDGEIDADDEEEKDYTIDRKGRRRPKKKKMSRARFNWLCLTFCLTWWVPIFPCGKLKRADVRMAFREKVALCIIIFFLCCFLLFFIIVFGRLICPKVPLYSTSELQSFNDVNNVWVYAYGRAFFINDIVNNHIQSYGMQKYEWAAFSGRDVSSFFYKGVAFEKYCPGLAAPQDGWDNYPGRRNPPNLTKYPYHNANSSDGTPRSYLEYMNQYARARVGWTKDYVAQFASTNNKLIIIYDNVYDVSAYFNANNNFMGNNINRLFGNYVGKDASQQFNDIKNQEGSKNAMTYLNCMNNLFYIGTIDHRNDFRCQFSNYILLATTVFIVLVIAVKFFSSLQFGSARDPEDHDKFIILQVPCYTEGVESLTKTLESLALLKYDDKRKLLFVIADGMIIGSGNDRPTPRIVLDILGVDPSVDPEPLSFQSLGEGDKQHNMGKVYSGLYETHGRSVPFIVVVKVGKFSERNRPGNRGKRDSQLILMRFLNRVHFNAEMSPLELDIYHNLKNIIGVNPSFYEYILMVDADTEVYAPSLNRMISTMIHDSRIMGLCGETLISNDRQSWTTMIQVYEYFISHHLAKAFESLFGAVTCLPGCFCLYRVRTPTKNIPLLIAPSIVDDYSENNVDTLHLKNLLHLGEDRYLTTLMMKNFPSFKLCFTADAKCKTVVPDRWPVLLSQRRRWINSTIHNLIELVMLPQLCGFCFLSMRFIVFLDLFSTVVQPAAFIYIIYLIYSCIATPDQFPLISVVMIAVIYGLQVIIFIIRRQWAQIGWMLIYLLAMPVFSFYIPIYAFWHFDDFSWGNTRVVVEKGRKVVTTDVVPFDKKSIPLKKWQDYEKENWEHASSKSDSRGSADIDRKSSLNGAFAQVVPSAAGSVYGVPPYHPPTISGSGIGSVAGSVYGGVPSAAAVPASVYGGSIAPSYANSNRHSMYSVAPTVSRGPTDDDILREVKRILATANLMDVTKKQIRDELTAIFGVDMTPRKATINAFIEEVLQGNL